MSIINADFDNAKVKEKLAKLHIFARVAPRKRLLDVGYELLRLSQQQVPHGVGVTEGGTDPHPGALQNSGSVEEIAGDVEVGYHTPYAHRLHEHPEYHFNLGRKGKYLTDPLEQNLEVFNKYLGEKLNIDMGEIIHE